MMYPNNDPGEQGSYLWEKDGDPSDQIFVF